MTSLPQGLLGTPDMHVAGYGSYGNVLRWFADRSDRRCADRLGGKRAAVDVQGADTRLGSVAELRTATLAAMGVALFQQPGILALEEERSAAIVRRGQMTMSPMRIVWIAIFLLC